MGFSDFWLQFNNGKKEQLKASLSSVKKEQVDKKFENLFNIFDVNKDGALDEAELKNIESQLEIFAGEDKVLNPSENSAAASIFANDLNTEEADFMGFVKSVSDASNEVSISSKFDFKEQQFYQTLSNIMASNGRVKYDTRLVAEMFKQIESSQAGWTRKGNTFSNGTANDITITEVSSIRYDKGVLDIKNGQERFYRVSAYSNQDNILTEYVFDQNGNFQYKEISNKHNPNLAQKICPDGTSYLDEYENGRLISRQIKNQDGNTTEILNLEYENNKIKESVKIYTEFSSDAERRNKVVVELNTGKYQILEKDSQGKYTKIIESSINDSIPILDEKGNITRYQPVTQYIMKFDEKGKSYLHHTNTIDLEEIENNLAPNEHCDYSQIDKEINETIVNTMKINLQTTIELLKNWNSQKSYLDASAILDKISSAWGGDIDSFIDKMENDLKKVETMEKTANKAEFAKLYCELTGVREFNTKEKQKWLDISTDLAKLNMTGLADTSDINTYIQCTAKGLKDTRFISTLNNAKGSLNDLETTGVAIDILGMVLEFKAIGVAINWFLKGTKWLFNATKGARIAKYVSTAGEYLKSEREVAKILNACATRVNNSLVSGLNFATYDALHEYGRQLHNNEKFNETSVLEAAWHGSKLGFTSSMLSSIIAPQVMKLFKNKQDFAKIEEAIENCFKKGKTSGEEIAKAVASAQAEMGLAAKATNFVLEVGTFTASASTIDLLEEKNIKDIIRQNNINNLTEEQIDNLTITGLMKAVLDAQGNDTSQMSDLEIWENYAISQYKEQFVGLGQIKLAENVIGMFLTKGKLPVNGKYGARVKALELEYDQNGKPYLKSDPNKKILSSEELAGMTYKAMAYDALEARLTNKFNEYKNKPMNGKEFIDAAIGKHDYCPADDLNIRVTEDGKFEVSDVNTKIETVVVGSIEEVLALQQMYNTTEAVKQMFLAETQGVNSGANEGVNNGVNEGTKPVEPNHESYRISIPIRLKSKLHDEFHVTGNAIYYRMLGEWQERGLTREQMIREEFDVSKFGDSDWEQAYAWLDKIITNVEKIDKSFDGILPSLTPATYYRGMIVEPDSRTMRIISDAKPGDVIVPDTGYAWGTPNEKYAEDFAQTLSGNSSPEQCVIMKIKTGAGVSLSRDINISLDNIELNPYTNVNVVFRRMAQYRVLEKEIKDGKVYITLEYLGVEKHNKTNNGTPNTTYSDFTQKLYNIGKKAEVYELSDGRKIVKVKSGLVGNKYDLYEFDSNGNLTEIREKVSGKEADKIYNNFEDKSPQTVKKGSGTLSMGGLGDLTDQANANDAYNKFKKALFNQPLVETLPQKIARKLSNGEIYELHIENLLCKSINDNAEILEALIRLNNKDANYDRITGFPLHFIPQKLKEMVKRNSEDAIFDRVTGKNIKEELLNFLKNNFNKLVDLDDLQAYTILLKNLIRRNVLDANYDRITGLPLYFIPQELKEMVKRNRGDANFDRFSGKNIKEEIINFLKNNRELIFSELLPKQYYEFSKLKHELANILENNILDILGIKNKDAFIENLARSIIDVRVANNIEATELIINNNFSTLIGDDIHIRIEDKKGYIYKVDKSTGAVTSINKGDKTLNIDTGEKTQTKIVYEPITTRIAEPFVSDENAPKISHKLEYIEVYRSSADGKDITYEKMRESKVPGNYEIYSYITTPDGQLIKDLIGLAEYDGKGGVHIEKNVKSLNGTMTQTVYADDAQGNRFSYYKITDVNGNILYESTGKFKKLSEDHYQSFFDGQGYDIQYSQDKVVITKLDKNNNLTDEKIEYTIRDFTIIDYSNFYSELNNNLKELEKAGTNLTNDILDSKDMQRVDVEALLKDNNIQEYTIDRKLIPMLKGLAGEDYFNLRNHTKILIGELPAENSALSIAGGIVVSKEHYSKLSTLLHEAGHEHTFGRNLLDDTELNSIYEREKAAFLQTFPDETIATLAYFLSQNEVCQVNPAGNLIKIRQMRGLNEASAETKLITKYHSEWNVTQARTALLQQYFPETIACIARKMKANATVQNENVRIATVNGIADPSPENAPEQSSHIETHFETMSPDAAEKVIYNSIIHNSEENVEKFHGHIYPKSLLSYCEIDGKVCKELVDIESELLLKFPLGSDYKVMTIMDLFKTKSGIDRLAIEKFKELSTRDYEKDEEIADKLKSCKDSQGRFREDYYSKLQQIESPEDKYAYWVLDECKVNGDIDESIWAKAVELQSLGFSSSDIRSLIKSCRTTDSSLKIIDFSDELYQRVLDLKQNHNVPNGEIYQIIDKCKTKDGAFNEEKYNFAIELSSHIDNGIADCIHWLIGCENKEELFNRLDEMKNKYGIKDDYKRFYELSCDIIQDGKVVDDTPWNAEYTLRFNKDKFKRVMNLASELNIRPMQLQTLIKYCYKNGKFDEVTYNTISNLYRAGMTDGFDLQIIIGDCIYKRDRGETSIVNHKLMEKLAQWFISYVEIKSAQEPNKDINIIKNNARIFVQRMIGKINNIECEATEYIQKFIGAGLIDNIGEILEVASIKDNKANNSFQEPEKHYDKKVMDRILSLQNKYKLDSEDVNKAINYLKNNYEVENLTSEEKITYLESLDKLFAASGSPKDILEQIKKAELTFELNMIVTPECLDTYTKYMKQGVDFKTIDIVENFSCPEKYKDNPDVFIDKVLSFINSLPKEMQKYPKTLCHLEEWADIITETVKQNNNEQFIKEYMHMLQYQIATYELETPEFRQNVIHILECAKEHPDKLREIETVLEKTGYHSESDYGIQEVCLKNIDRYEDILLSQRPLTGRENERVSYKTGMAKDYIVKFSKAGIPIEDALKVTDYLCKNTNPLEPISDTVVNEIIKLYNAKKLDDTSLSIIKNLQFLEESAEVIDYLISLKEQNKLIEPMFNRGILNILKLIKTNNQRAFCENYKEIIDFFANNTKAFDEIYKELSSISKEGIINDMLKQCIIIKDNDYSNAKRDIDLMQKVLDYTRQGFVSYEIFKNYCISYSKGYEDVKSFIDLLDKVDLEKYKDEVNLILEHCNPKNAATNPNLTKESWEFILDVQKLLIENKTEQQDEPEVINSGFLNIFRDGKIPDEVLNRLQFYIESSISNPDVFDVAGFSVKIAKDLVKLCTLRPDKIVLFEDILYNSHLSNEYVLDRFSKSKDVLDKQLELYDIFNDYSKLYYLIKNDESVGDVEAKIEIYQCQSKYKKPLLNRIGNNDKTLMSILSDTREYNKDIIKTAIAQGQKLDIIKSLAFHSTKENASFILELMNTKDYDIEYINALAIKIRVKTQVDFAKKLIEQGGFSIKQIIYIAHSVQADRERVELAELLCFDKKLNFPKEYIADIVDATNPKYLDFTKKLCYDKEIDPKYISQIVKFVTSDEQLEIAEELLSTKDFKNWTCRNIDNGLDINTIYSLSKTQSKIYHEINQAQKAVEDKAKKEAARIAQEQASKKTQTVQADPRALEEITEALVRTGVNENRAKGDYAKVCVDSNGNVDKEKLEAACALIKVFGFTYSIKKKTGERVSNPNISSKDIADIFKYTIGNHMSAQNGVFRPEIIKDIITLKKAGIDDVKFIANLAYIKNMGLIEMKARLSGEERRGVVSRIEALSGDVIESAKRLGIDIDAIKEKAQTSDKKISNLKIKEGIPAASIEVRTLDSIVGTERVVLNKFKDKVPQEIWQDKAAFHQWALEQITGKKDADGNIAEEGIYNPETEEIRSDLLAKDNYAAYNDARIRGIKEWYEFLNSDESNVKDDIFAQLLFLDGMTKDMKPNNAVTPPAISHETFEQVYNTLLEDNTTVSVTKKYNEINRNKAVEQYGKETVVDGIKGIWVRIPSGGKRGEPEYDEHIAMVQALSEGSSWCLRFENAHTYLANGDLYFFVTKKNDGSYESQVAINMNKNNQITQIQKRYNQDSTVPIPYAKVIDEWRRDENGNIRFEGLNNQIQKALDAKPEFDRQKAEFSKMLESGDYKGLFSALGIECKIARDGTFVLDKYSAFVPKTKYTLYDLGIDENQLMQKVSNITGTLDIKASAITALPSLKEVGDINFDNGNSSISGLSSLEKIGECNVYWDKKDKN